MHHLRLEFFYRQAGQTPGFARAPVRLARQFSGIFLDFNLPLSQLLLGALHLAVQPGKLARLELMPLADLLHLQHRPLVRLVGLVEGLPGLAQACFQLTFLPALAVELLRVSCNRALDLLHLLLASCQRALQFLDSPRAANGARAGYLARQQPSRCRERPRLAG